jgi:phospholipase/lecithinase/hemolysin
MKNFISRTLCVLGVVSFFFFASHLGSTQQFNDIIAFGDSLTDVGNVAGLTEPGIAPIINGYFQETHFSDNILWIETLANYLGLPPRTLGRGNSTTLPAEPQGNTWAWGGSEAAFGSAQPSGVTEPIPNLLKEINQFLKVNVPNVETLYTIWSGADNLLVGGRFGPKAAKKAVKAVCTAIQLLEKAGARHILVFNMPKLGDTPNAQSGGRIDEIAADIYSYSYNKALRKALKKLRSDNHFKASIYFVNVFTELALVVDTVNKGGTYTPNFFVPGAPVAINNVTSEGLNYFNANGAFPTNYLFWDDVHPTTQGHQVIAGLVLKSLQKPE